MKHTETRKKRFTKYMRPAFIMLILFGVLLINPSCKSDDNNTPPPPATTTSSTTSATTSGTTSATTSGTTAAQTASVTIMDFSFSPGTTTIKAGGSVKWTNNGPSTHTVTSDQGTFDSGNIPMGGTFTQTFATAGTYTYHCSIHPQMVGTITVQ